MVYVVMEKIFFYGLSPRVTLDSGYAKWFSPIYHNLVRNDVSCNFIKYNSFFYNTYTSNIILEPLYNSYLISKFINKMDNDSLLHVLNQKPQYSVISKYLKIYGRNNIKKVITVHDIFSSNGSIDYNINKLLQEYELIFSPSEFTKNEIKKEFSLENVFVTYNPIDNNIFYKLNCVENIKFKKILCSNYNIDIDSNIILFVGSEMERKNIPGLIETFRELNKLNNNNILIIVSKITKNRNNYLEYATKLKVIDRILWLSEISEKMLLSIYNVSDIFLTLSKGEGFCMPAVEAMACGIPVIASNSSSLKEIVGDYGILVNPDNVKENANVIANVLQSQHIRRDMSLKGLKRANDFSVDKIVDRYVIGYDKLS